MVRIFSYIFKIGACYGFYIMDDQLFKAIGVILAIGFILELVDDIKKGIIIK
jgi:hypothetical protein